jgi:glycerol uptake facilitator-like aquaporin
MSWRDVPGYIVAQAAGAVLGVWAAHLMFAEPLLQVSRHIREIRRGHRWPLHHNFNAPSAVEGTDEKRLGAFRKVRDDPLAYLEKFPQTRIDERREIRGETFLYRFCTGYLLLRLLTTSATFQNQ